MDMTYREYMNNYYEAQARVGTACICNDRASEALDDMKEIVCVLNTLIHLLALKTGAENLDKPIDAALKKALEIQARFNAKYGKQPKKAAA